MWCPNIWSLQRWRSRIFEDANRGLTSKVPAHGTCYPFNLSLSHYHPAAGCIRPRRVIFHWYYETSVPLLLLCNLITTEDDISIHCAILLGAVCSGVAKFVGIWVSCKLHSSSQWLQRYEWNFFPVYWRWCSWKLYKNVCEDDMNCKMFWWLNVTKLWQ
jgi:hypothetical protein